MGTDLGASISRWLGSGSYEVSNNSLVSKASSGIPMMHNTSQSVIIRHREYVTDIAGNTGFAIVATLPLNPGLSVTFPWLSTIAQQFQEYTFKGLVFHYVPTSGDAIASTNSALGSVIISTNYRSTDPAYTNKQQMLNEYFSGDAKPSESFCHPIECNPKENPFNVQYVRVGAVPSGQDQKMYDLGQTYVATNAQQTAFTCGELWVTYEVELRKPVLFGTLSYESAYAFYNLNGLMSSSACLGTSAPSLVLDTFVNGGLSITTAAGYVTIPRGNAGKYLVDVGMAGISAINFSILPVLNCTVGAPSQQPTVSSSVYTGQLMAFINTVTVTDPTNAAVFQCFITSSSGSITGNLRVMEINSNAL